MAVLSTATASGRKFYQGAPGTAATTLYTSPSANSNVTSPSSTAYIKEIILTNLSSSPAWISIYVNGSVGSNAVIYQLSVGANDVKILSGLNTMMDAGGTIVGLQQTASTINVCISGVEIQ